MNVNVNTNNLRFIVIQPTVGAWGTLNIRVRANLSRNDAVHVPALLDAIFDAGNGEGYIEWVREYDRARDGYGLVSLSVGDVICLPYGYGEWKCTSNGWLLVTGSNEHATL